MHIDTRRTICAIKMQVWYIRTHMLPFLLGLHGKVLALADYRGGFCGKLLEACPTEPMPVSSEMGWREGRCL